jgi:hypothetical protein
MLSKQSWAYRATFGVATALAVVTGACGEVKEDNCQDSVLAKLAGECEEYQGNSGGTGTGGHAGSVSSGGSVTSGGKAGTGGKVGTGGKGGTGGTGPTDPIVVFEWGEKETEDPFDAGEWRVDSTVGVHSGEIAVHPPTLAAGDELSMTFNCGGAEHTQISFMVRRLSGSAELELFDGEASRGTVIAYDSWQRQVVDVEPGKHTYTFTARNIGTTNIGVPFVVDSFVCKNATRSYGVNGFANSDDGAIPLEMTGEWFVDNLRSIHQGEAAVHPSMLKPGDSRSMTFSCEEEHSQLSFLARRLSGNAELELFDGTVSRGTIVAYDSWLPQVVNVPLGKHTYTFTARNVGTTTIDVPFVLDTFVCRKESPAPALNGFIDFDQGFIPLEIEGDWFVDNLRSIHQGEAAFHPPALEPGDEKVMSIECAAAELRFVVRRTSGNAQLELDDGHVPQEITAYDSWANQVVRLAGSTAITLTARNTGTTPIDVPFVVDTVVCVQ